MIAELPPGSILILGAFLIPLLSGRPQSLYLLLLPVLSFIQLLVLPADLQWRLSFLGYELMPVRLDRLSLVFGYIFHIATLISVIYSLHVRDTVQQATGLIYAGSAIGAVFAGDLITLFVYWELTALSSVFLIWSRRTARARQAGLRYLVIQIVSGLLLLLGTLVHLQGTGSLAFGHLGLDSPGGVLIFLAFGIKCAFPLLHNWLQDAYPEATVTGTVFLSVFTTKLAVYALARSYAGTEILIPIGVVMTLFPILYAVIEDDLRRVLSYSLNNQLGFMVVGVGVGTELALNGTVSHAFAHILYKALLFMSMGALLLQAGTVKASELGGAWRSMPITAFFCLIGAVSISAFPLFSGFVTKSLTMSAVAGENHQIAFFALLFASAGVMHHSGIKIPFCGFFSPGTGRPVQCGEPPLNMLVAMGTTALLCLAIGVYPQSLYQLLPYPVDYQPYTSSHVINQLQLLIFALLAFAWLERRRLEPPALPGINLDTDWTYRRLLPLVVRKLMTVGAPIDNAIRRGASGYVRMIIRELSRHHEPHGLLARVWPTGSMVLWVAILLGAYLLAYLL